MDSATPGIVYTKRTNSQGAVRAIESLPSMLVYYLALSRAIKKYPVLSRLQTMGPSPKNVSTRSYPLFRRGC